MDAPIAIAGLVGLLALAKTSVDYLRTVAAWLRHEPGMFASVLHRTFAYVVGVGLVFLYGASQLGDFEIPGTGLALVDMDGATKLIVGLSVGSLASLYADYLKARDNTDSAKVPPITNR